MLKSKEYQIGNNKPTNTTAMWTETIAPLHLGKIVLGFFMDAALTPVEFKETATRKRIGMMRKSYAEVKKSLTPQAEDALNEIEVGFNCISGHLGYPSSEITDVRGCGSGSFQEWSLGMAEKVKKWRNECDAKFTGAVIDYAVFGKPFLQIAIETGKTRQTVSKYFYAGLDEYCKIHFK